MLISRGECALREWGYDKIIWLFETESLKSARARRQKIAASQKKTQNRKSFRSLQPGLNTNYQRDRITASSKHTLTRYRPFSASLNNCCGRRNFSKSPQVHRRSRFFSACLLGQNLRKEIAESSSCVCHTAIICCSFSSLILNDR
jgi:hypothetical protein